MSLTDHYAEIEGCKVHYMESAPLTEQAETIIFLHGFPEYWATWHSQLAFFSKKYRVIAPDLPGYNLSDKPTDNAFYTLPRLIGFMAKFVQKVAPEQKVFLVAHDWGGAIAWPLVAFHKELFFKLIILNSGHPSTFTREMIHNREQQGKSAYIHDFVSNKGVTKITANNYARLQDTLFKGMRQGSLSTDQKMAYLQAWQQPGATLGMLQYYRAMPQQPPSLNKSTPASIDMMTIPNIRITLPTLILWGELDEAFVIENLNGIEQYVPDCKIVRFPDASHWLQHDLPLEVNTEIQNFIGSI
jgi:epoxide hydrolase 4